MVHGLTTAPSHALFCYASAILRHELRKLQCLHSAKIHSSPCLWTSKLYNHPRAKANMEKRQARWMERTVKMAAESTKKLAKVSPNQLGETPEPKWSVNRYVSNMGHMPRRAEVLNSLLVERVAELVQSSIVEVDGITGADIDITGVNVNKGYGQFNVLWAPRFDDEQFNRRVDALLAKLAPALQTQITEERVIAGRIPRIEFVRDRDVTERHKIDALVTKVEQENLQAAQEEAARKAAETGVAGEATSNFIDEIVLSEVTVPLEDEAPAEPAIDHASRLRKVGRIGGLEMESIVQQLRSKSRSRTGG